MQRQRFPSGRTTRAAVFPNVAAGFSKNHFEDFLTLRLMACAMIGRQQRSEGRSPGLRLPDTARDKAHELRFDADRIASCGNSAGAGIVLWIGFHDDLFNPKTVPRRVKGLLRGLLRA